MSETKRKVCPDCGAGLDVELENHTGYAKFWFVCTADDEDCDWCSCPFRGPVRDTDEIDEIGREEHVKRFRKAAYVKAAQVEQDELED